MNTTEWCTIMKKIINYIVEFFKPDTYPVGLKQFKFKKQINSKPIKYDWQFDYTPESVPAYKSLRSFYK